MKEILVIRHGELENPKGIVYNRDSVMRVEDIIHLSDKGRAQFPLLAKEIIQQGKVPTILWTSPEIRAQESAEILRSELGLSEVKIDLGIDEVYAPGPYLEGMMMAEFVANNTDVYAPERWEKYKHETSEALTERVLATITRMIGELGEGEVGAIVSHGDPIAYLLSYLQNGVIPDQAKVRGMMYPPKGSATLITYDANNKYQEMKQIGESSGKIY